MAGFKPTKKTVVIPETAEALLNDLKDRQIPGLLAHQADLLRAYHKDFENSPHVAVQMPTGSGKTLVGMLIAEWRRRKYGERVVYLCPTKQLVNQVVAQSNDQYAIKAHAFTGRQKEYDPSQKTDYNSGDVVAVTTYSGLFNVNPFFENPNVIIADDAHAAENYVSSYWTLKIDRKDNAVAFEAVAQLLHPHLSAHDAALLAQDDLRRWLQKLPTPVLHKIAPELSTLLSEHAKDKDSDFKFAWSVLKGQLHACHLYLSYDEIILRPLLPPTKTFEPFAAAKQRIYMSATLGAGGDLERIWGVEEISRLPVPTGWDKQGIGRRFFLFPDLSLFAPQRDQLLKDFMKSTPRTLVLVPSDAQAKPFRQLAADSGMKVFAAKEIEESKKAFVETNGAAAIMAGRYDGIDFIQNDCRLEVLSGLPRALNLQERFFVEKLGADSLLQDRMFTRITQGFGRCTRSTTDYACVVIVGDDFTTFMQQRENRQYLHPELQAEAGYGLDQSKHSPETDFLDYFKWFLSRSPEWKSAESDIVSLRASKTATPFPNAAELQACVKDEVRYCNALWNGDFDYTLDRARDVLDKLNGESLRPYRALWYYLAGSAAWLGADAPGQEQRRYLARDLFAKAAQAAPGKPVKWLLDLTRPSVTEGAVPIGDAGERRLVAIVERCEQRLLVLGVSAHNNKFETEVKEIIAGLARKDDAKPFEIAHVRLGRLLGYVADGATNDTAAPDAWWIADDLCFVFEDHNNAKEGTEHYPVSKTRQTALHPKWIEANVKELEKNTEIIPVAITPCKMLAAEAAPLALNSGYWELEGFRAWANDALSHIRTLRAKSPGQPDLEWRAAAISTFKSQGLAPNALAARFSAQRLSLLPTKKT